MKNLSGTRILNCNGNSPYRDGRLTVRDLGSKVNESKHEIDQLKLTLDARKEAGQSEHVPPGVDVPENAEVLDEEQFKLLQK
jgi:hypothetical protein